MEKALIILFVTVPLILWGVTVLLIINGVNKKKKWNECIGIIADFYENTSVMRLNSYETTAISPVVSYEVDGQKYDFIGNFYSTNMKVGQKLNVLYDKNNFSKATIKKGLYIAPMITGGLAILFTIPIIVFIILKSKNLINF